MRHRKILAKSSNKKERIWAYALGTIGISFALFVLYLRNFIHPDMTNPEFSKWLWIRDNNWIYLVVLIVLLVFMLYKSNETFIKQTLKKDRE